MNSTRPRFRFLSRLLVAAVAAATPALAVHRAAADPAPGEALPVVRLELEPATAPVPALKYELLPREIERTPGNAAHLYHRAELSAAPFAGLQPRIADWLDKPLAELPAEELRQQLSQLAVVLEDVDVGARREGCDWELPIRGNPDPFSIRLPEMQDARSLARIVALRARLQLFDRDFDGAVHSLETGFSLGRDIARAPLAIPGLIGIAICQVMAARIQELEECPGAPSLYWALTTLPDPLIDIGPAIETEGGLLDQMFPFLRDARTARRTPGQWQALLYETTQKLIRWDGDSRAFGRFIDEPTASSLQLTGWIIKGYPLARRYLLETGMTAAEVDALPVGQVVAIYSADLVDRLRDEFLKWRRVPGAQAIEGLERAEQMQSESEEIFPFARTVWPAFRQFFVAARRLDRRIAELRLIEALRLYAGRHGGALPATLAGIRDVPVPDDPISGGKFNYRVEGEMAVIEIPAPPRFDARLGRRYELTIRQRKQAAKAVEP